jgi:hypothetical protein
LVLTGKHLFEKVQHSSFSNRRSRRSFLPQEARRGLRVAARAFFRLSCPRCSLVTAREHGSRLGARTPALATGHAAKLP